MFKMSNIRPRIHPRISLRNYERLVAHTRGTQQSQSEISDMAFTLYFSNAHAEAYETTLLRRLDKETESIGRLERDIRLLTDAFTLYLQYFFTVVPDIPPAKSDLRASQGVKYFHDFLDKYRDFVSGGGANIKNAVEDLLKTDGSFYSKTDIEQLKKRSKTGANA